MTRVSFLEKCRCPGVLFSETISVGSNPRSYSVLTTVYTVTKIACKNHPILTPIFDYDDQLSRSGFGVKPEPEQPAGGWRLRMADADGKIRIIPPPTKKTL